MTDYSQEINGFQQSNAAQGAPAVPPAQAQRAVAQGQPDLMHSPAAQDTAQAQHNAAIISRSPHVSQWVSSTHPAHVAASADHFPWMEGMGQAWDAIKGMFYVPPGPERGAPRDVTGGKPVWMPDGGKSESGQEILKEGSEGLKAAFGPSQKITGPVDNWLRRNYPNVEAASQGVYGYAQRAMGTLEAASAPVMGPLSAAARPIEAATGINRMAVPQILGVLAGLGGKLAKAPEAAVEGEHVPPAKPTATTPAPHPADIIQSMGSAVQAHPLTKAAPDTMKEFLGQQTQGSPLETIRISGEAVKRAYDSAGIEPNLKDGILGWVPDLHKQLGQALATGGDVEVPLRDYLANTGMDAQNQLAGGIRLGDEETRDSEQELAKRQLETKPEAPSEGEGKDQLGAGAPDHIINSALSGLPDEVKQAVSEETKKYWLNNLFDKAKTFDMSEPQARAYSKLIEERFSKLADSLKAELGRQQKAVTAELLQKHLPDVRSELASIPEIAARHAQAYGELPTGEKPFDMQGLSKDDMAELFGFDNGAAMDKAIEPLEAHRTSQKSKPSIKAHFEQLVKTEAHSRASAEAGTLSPAMVEEITRDALIGDHAQVLLSHEMNVLAKAARDKGENVPPITKEQLAAHAEKLFDDVPVSQARNIKYWERLAFRNGREAEYRGIKGDAKGAFEAKQQQALATRMLQRSHAFKAFSESSFKKWKAWAGNTTMSSIEQPWLDQMHAVLSDMGFSVARDPVELQRALAAQPAFLDKQIRNGAEVYQWPVPKGTKIRNWTVQDYQGVADMLKSFAHNGNEAARLSHYLAKMDFADIINGIRDKLSDRGDRALTQAEVVERVQEPGLKGALHNLRGSAWAPPFMMDRLDGQDPFGPWHRALDRPIQEGTNWKNDKLAEIGGKLKALAKAEPKGWKKRLDEGIDSGIKIKHDDGTASPYVRNRGELLSAALHFGSESGRAKLLAGTKTDEATWQKLFDKYLDDPYDRQVVNHFWDTFDDLWTHVEALSRRKSGVAPTKLVKAPFKINGDPMKGGYNWADYAQELSTEEQRGGQDRRDPFDLPNYQRATPPHGYTKARTEFTAPFDLNLDNLHVRIAQIVHDVAFREPVSLAAKVLSSPAARMAIEKTLGPEYPKQFDNWIQRVANAQAFDARALDGLNKVARASRYSMAMVQLGFRSTTMFKHLISAWSKSADELGGGTIARASREFWIHPIQASKDVRAESSFMKHRFETNERDIAGKVQRLFQKQGYVSNAQMFAFHMVGASDWVSAVPAYTAARDAALLKGETLQDAIYVGERAVRRAHGSGTPADLSALMDPRGENAEVTKNFSNFMTFFHNTLQRMYELPEKKVTGIITSLAYLMIVPAIADFFISGKQKDPPDTWAKSAAEALTLVGTGGMPVIRPIAETMVPSLLEGKKPDIYHLVAAESIIESWGRTAVNASNAVAGKHVSRTWLKDAIESGGYATATPGSGWAAQLAQYLYDNYEGQVPEGTSPLSGVLFGEHPKARH